MSLINSTFEYNYLEVVIIFLLDQFINNNYFLKGILRDRLMVGHQVLALAVGVRIPVPQLNKNNKLSHLNI